MAVVHFYNEDYSFDIPFKNKARKWLLQAAESEGFSIVQINYIFTSDQHLLSINRQFLKHNTLTDIVTFDNSETRGEIEADIYISIPRVEENAKKFKQPFSRELSRVLIHGLLHLVGYKDKSSSSKKQMRKKEDAYLSLLNI